MKVEKTTTGVIIKEPSEEIKNKCLQYLSLSNPTREYFIYNQKSTMPDNKSLKGISDVICVTSGFLSIKDNTIMQLSKSASTITPHPGKKITIKMNREPRSELQIDAIKKMTESDANKLTLEVKPGSGKTFMALYTIAKLGLKPLIVTPSTLLKNQWVENLIDLGIDKNDIATYINDSVNKNFCVVTISSMENAMRDDWGQLMEVVDRADFGIKIIDEAHLHLKGLLKFDALCNIKHNWYLSATLGRSNASEDTILNRALLDADRFVGNGLYEEYQHEYVNIYLQDIYYYPSRKLCEKHFRYGKHGLIRSTYYNMLMDYGGGKPFVKNIIMMIKRIKEIVNYGKVLILVPLITTIEVVIKEIERDPYFKNLSFASVDGSMSISNKRQALEKDIIVSTSMSMGVGVDISDLGAVVNFDQYSSPIINEQIVGRLRDRGKETYYVDICDHVKYARVLENWGRKRRILIPYFPGVNPNIKVFKKISS